MKAVIMLCLTVLWCAGCAASAAPTAGCRPTGWVDRVEGLWVIIELDDEDAETLVLPTSCFREPVHGGLRIVNGVVDREETEAMRRRMAAIVARVSKVEDED